MNALAISPLNTAKGRPWRPSILFEEKHILDLEQLFVYFWNVEMCFSNICELVMPSLFKKLFVCLELGLNFLPPIVECKVEFCWRTSINVRQELSPLKGEPHAEESPKLDFQISKVRFLFYRRLRRFIGAS